MPYKIMLTRNDNHIGIFDLKTWLDKYATCAFNEKNMQGWVYTDYGLREIQRIIPNAGYDVKILETLNQE